MTRHLSTDGFCLSTPSRPLQRGLLACYAYSSPSSEAVQFDIAVAVVGSNMKKRETWDALIRKVTEHAGHGLNQVELFGTTHSKSPGEHQAGPKEWAPKDMAALTVEPAGRVVAFFQTHCPTAEVTVVDIPGDTIKLSQVHLAEGIGKRLSPDSPLQPPPSTASTESTELKLQKLLDFLAKLTLEDLIRLPSAQQQTLFQIQSAVERNQLATTPSNASTVLRTPTGHGVPMPSGGSSVSEHDAPPRLGAAIGDDDAAGVGTLPFADDVHTALAAAEPELMNTVIPAELDNGRLPAFDSDALPPLMPWGLFV